MRSISSTTGWRSSSPTPSARQLGYLTACPTNVGTGIRVGVMLHLPGLVQTKQIDKVFRALQKINLAVRGLYGEGSQASGDFYQISNQQTLGKSEPELIKILTDVVPQVLAVRADGPPDPAHRAAAAPPRPGQPGLWRPQDGPDDLQRRDDAPAFERPDGDQPRPDRRPVDRHGQRAVHPDPAGLPPEAPRLGAGRRGAERRPGTRTCGAGCPTVGKHRVIDRSVPAGHDPGVVAIDDPVPPPRPGRRTCPSSASRSTRSRSSA